MDLETRVRLEIILLNEAQANNQHYLFNHMRHAPWGGGGVNRQGKMVDANTMVNRVMLHLLGYNCYLYTGIGAIGISHGVRMPPSQLID